MPQALVFVSGALASIGAPAFLQSALGWLAIGANTFLGGALLSIGVSFGINYLVATMMKPKSPKPEDVQNNIRNAISPRIRHYGRVKTGGTLAFINSKNGHLHKVLAMGHGEADAIEEYWVDSNRVYPDASAQVYDEPYVRRDVSRLRIYTRRGLPNQAVYTGVSTVFPEWTSNHKGNGILSLYAYQMAVKADEFQQTFPNGVGTVYRLVIRGSKVFDPTDTAQSIARPSTWTWSDNLASIVLDYMHHRDGMRIPVSLLTTPLALAGWRQAALDCYDPIPLMGGGFEPRYRLWGSYSLEERPADVLSRMLTCGEGRIVPTPDGGITIDVGKWREPTVTIDDSVIVSFDGLGRGRDILNTANVINGSYLSAEHDYQTTDAQAWSDDNDVAERGEIPTSVEYLMTPSHSQCRRLMKIAANEASPEWVGSFTLNLKGLRAIGERAIRIVYPAFKIDGFFKVRDARFLIGEGATLIGVQIEVSSTGQQVYQWNPAIEEGSPPAADDVQADNNIPLPSGFQVVIERQNIGGTTIAVAKASWSVPSSDALAIQIQFKRSVDTAWSLFNTTPDETVAYTGALLDGEEYEFRARNTTIAGRTGNWTSIIRLIAVADASAPASVLDVEATDGFSSVTITWVSPNSGNYRATNIYRGAADNPATSILVATKWGAASSSDTYADTELSPGTYYYWLRARNGSGIESAFVATGAVTVS